jgi:hypothetical protein
MTTLREAAKLALEALELEEAQTAYPSHFLKKAMGVVRTALAIQTVPSDCSDSHQPVAWMVYTQDGTSAFVTANPADFTQDHRALPLYTAPPLSMTISGDCATSRSSNRREWQGLTHEERDEICKDFVGDDGRVGAYLSLALEVEVRLTEKNRSEE